ncbi:nucleotide exchange factor GrpE [uncultured Thiodictyon sp.]|uniref:nucleotide exchange factor GrpE n=1 Tax=uncultured Thiodictyon sp. TaxID=1846217 RepID=UPI0025E4DDC0|nr:nucleotide exchange factor GrpE [uncultured Thiodictyon sp.]
MTPESTDKQTPDVAAAAADSGSSAAELTAIEQHAATLAELNAELEAARAKADEHWDQLLRARAETENLRRRQAAELEKAHKYALDSFVRELLQVHDSLELGVAASLDPGADLTKLREGNELTLKLLGDVMTRFGVAPVEPEGLPFNPEFHQAMSVQPRADLAPNTVTVVLQKGYTLNGRLVRPALVMVSGAA